ncbi:MAG TPA: hypothetical protein VKT52_05700 [Ktedonobacterales bacterium]|nr:hypothetical protein [Ktedonobacterales bacterium]
MATCPESGDSVPATNVERGEIVPCPDCGAELVVRELTGGPHFGKPGGISVGSGRQRRGYDDVH